MIEEHFTWGDSLFHNLDPRGKIAAAIAYTTTVALLPGLTTPAVALAVSLCLVGIARLPLSAVVRRLLVVNLFTLFLWVSLPLTYGGEVAFRLGPLALSHEGILLAARITLKTNAIVLAIIPLVATSTIADIGSALDKLRFPKKISFLLLYSYRYIFVIHQEYTRLLRAAQMRSFSPGTNMHTYKTFAHLFGMTLVKSYNRAQRVHQAMILRGFNGRLVSLYRHRFGKADVIFLLTMAVVTLLLAFSGIVQHLS